MMDRGQQEIEAPHTRGYRLELGKSRHGNPVTQGLRDDLLQALRLFMYHIRIMIYLFEWR